MEKTAVALSKKDISLLIFLCWFAYTAAYVGRLNYNASQVLIIEFFNANRAEAGLIGSAFFFCYGVGQLVNGLLCKRYNSKIAIFAALALSCVLNVLMTLPSDISTLKYIWAANGVVQSVIWTSLVHMLSVYLPDNKIRRAILVMSTTVAIGTVLAYGISSLCAQFFNWQTVFYICSGIVGISALLWLILVNRIPNQKKFVDAYAQKNTAEENQEMLGHRNKAKKVVFIAFLFVIVAAISNGLIKDGVAVWTSIILQNIFSLPASVAIIITLILPLLSISGAFMANVLIKRQKNHMVVLLTVFSASVGALLALIFFASFILVLTVLCLTLLAILMAVANSVITSMIPLDWRKIAGSGKVAGLINMFCYVGSTISGYGIGRLSDINPSAPWQPVFVAMLAVAFLSAIFCAIAALFWKKKITPLTEQADYTDKLNK